MISVLSLFIIIALIYDLMKNNSTMSMISFLNNGFTIGMLVGLICLSFLK